MYIHNFSSSVSSVCFENTLHTGQGNKLVEKQLGLKILYTNTDYLPNKLEEIETFVHQNNIDIVALVETLDKRIPVIEQTNINFILPGFTTFQKNQGRGLCLFVKENLSVNRLEDLENLFDKSIFCKISNEHDHFILGIQYRSPSSIEADNKNLIEQTNFVANKCLSSNEKLILVGDYNFKKINWSEENCSVRNDDDDDEQFELHKMSKIKYDEKFLCCTQKNYLTQFVEQPTHHKPNTKPSLIDLILSNHPDFINNVLHNPPFGLSHHQVLTFNVNMSCPKNIANSTKKYLFHKGDFESIRNQLNQTDWDQVMGEHDDVDSCWENFVNVFVPLCNRSIPTKTFKQNKPKRNFNPPASLLQLFDLKRKAFKLSKKYPTTENEIFYIYMRDRVNTELRKANKIKELEVAKNGKTNPKALFQYVSSKTKPKENVPNLHTPEGKLTNTNEEKAQILNDFFGSVFTKEGNSDLPDCNIDVQIPLSKINISEDDIFKVLKGLNVNKSPGPDLIHPRILREFASELSYPIKRLFDKSLVHGKIPQSWKTAEVRPIHKKGARDIPDNYRPVSLTSVVCKILESFIRNALYDHLLSNNLLSPHQYGFCKGRSTVTQLLATINDWMVSLDSKTPVDAVYLDFSKAFDSVPHKRLLYKLHNYGIRGKLLEWIEDFLTDRTQYVSVNNKNSNLIKVTSGVPQGSVLGPALFIYLINDLPTQTDCKLKIFADDSKIYQNIVSPEDQAKLQVGIDALVEWSRRWLMNFNITVKSVRFFT